MSEIKGAFSKIDQDGNGAINTSKLSSLMQVMGENLTSTEIKIMLKLCDITECGEITFSAFCTMWVNYYLEEYSSEEKGREMTIEEIKAFFSAFDENGDGFISRNELQLGMKGLGEMVNSLEINSIIEEVDVDGDGRVNFKEFIALMRLKSKKDSKEDEMTDAELRAVFRIFDDDCSGYISRTEFGDVMNKRSGISEFDKGVDAMVKESNMEEDDRVTYEEFINQYHCITRKNKRM
jgi:Ca2+-binding EF-hand superfamily protein